MPNGITGAIALRMTAGVAYLLGMGDSILMPYTTNRMENAAKHVWPVPFVGEVVPPRNNGDTGASISCFIANNSGASAYLGPRGQGVRPGETFFDGTSGHNLTTCITEGFSGDAANFGTFYQLLNYPNNPHEVNWDSGKSLRTRVLCRGSATAPNSWNLRGRQRSAGAQADDGFAFVPIVTNAASAFFTTTVPFSRGTGATQIQIAVINSWNEVETTAMMMDILAIDVRLATPTTGVYWGYAGEGGYTTKSHLAVGESYDIGGFGAYVTRYSDAALDAHIAAFGFDTFWIHLGQNNANDEWNGTTIGNYKANVQAIIARVKASCARVGVANPKFLLTSPYDTSSPNTRFVLMAQALYEIQQADKTSVEFVDLRAYVETTYGGYAAWQAAKLVDGVHPTRAFSEELALYIYTTLTTAPPSAMGLAQTVPMIGISPWNRNGAGAAVVVP